MSTRVVLIEDEPMALQQLRDLVSSRGELLVVGEATNGLDAVEMVSTLRPDIAFLDIQLPGLDGLGVLQRMRHDSVVIFTTAFDRYAVSAFELGAVDFLLKPFGSARFAAAVERAHRELRHPPDVASPERARGSLQSEVPLSRLFVRERERIIPVSTRDVVRVEADGDYAALIVGGKRHLVEIPIAELERRLDPTRFVRIHRSHLINLDFVRSLRPFDAHRLSIELTDNSTIVASRSGSRTLRELVR